MVSTIHDSIARDIKTEHTCQGGIHIHRVDNLIGYSPRRYFAGPADQEGNAKGSFVARENAASPGSVETFSSNSPITPVVGCKNKYGVILHPQLFDGGQEFTDIGIRLREDVGEIAVAGLTPGVRMGVMRRMCLSVWKVKEERSVFLSLAFYVVERVIRNFSINRRTLLAAIDFQFFWLLATQCGHDMDETGPRILLIRAAVRPERSVR